MGPYLGCSLAVGLNLVQGFTLLKGAAGLRIML